MWECIKLGNARIVSHNGHWGPPAHPVPVMTDTGEEIF